MASRGLYIIQSLMDQVLYLRGAEENRLVLRKALKVHRAEHSMPSTQETAAETGFDSEEVIGTMAKELCFRSEALAGDFSLHIRAGQNHAVERVVIPACSRIYMTES